VCDTVRQARRWLDVGGRSYRFHDFRRDGLSPELLERFERAVGWETLLNRKGSTWRQLSESERSGLDRERALAVMLERPTLIKRPLLDTGARILVGFRTDLYAAEL